MSKAFQGLSEPQIKCLWNLARRQAAEPEEEWHTYGYTGAATQTIDAVIRKGLVEHKSVTHDNRWTQHFIRLSDSGRVKAEAYQADRYPDESIAETVAREERERVRRVEQAERESERQLKLAQEIAPIVGRASGNEGLAKLLAEGRTSFWVQGGHSITVDDLKSLIDLAPAGELPAATQADESSLAALLGD